MLTSIQKQAAQAIVNVFETGAARGKYGEVTLLEGDTGHLTFGRSQTTLGSGNLAILIERYCAQAGTRFGPRLAPWLEGLRGRDVSLDQDHRLHNVLRATADDPVMRDVQDAFFDSEYWKPAERRAEQIGIVSPLGVAVVYDSRVHGRWDALRAQTDARIGSVATAGERAWISAYIGTRRQWLAGARADLRPTVYRMDAFRRLIEQGQWNLELPFVVRDEEVSSLSLASLPPDCYEGPQPGSRTVAVATPLQRGLDVRLVQLGLSDRSVEIKADGIFGPASRDLVRAFQAQRGLPATGVVDPGMIAMLLEPA